jgi:hypothetical protein
MIRRVSLNLAAGRYDACPKLAWGAAPAYSRRVSRMRVRPLTCPSAGSGSSWAAHFSRDSGAVHDAA